MNFAAWTLFIIALIALGATWVIGEQRVRDAATRRSMAVKAAQSDLAAERDRRDKEIERKRNGLVKLQEQTLALEDQIAGYDARIEAAQDTTPEPVGDGLTDAERRERAQLIQEIALMRGEIKEMRDKLYELQRR